MIIIIFIIIIIIIIFIIITIIIIIIIVSILEINIIIVIIITRIIVANFIINDFVIVVCMNNNLDFVTLEVTYPNLYLLNLYVLNIGAQRKRQCFPLAAPFHITGHCHIKIIIEFSSIGPTVKL